MQPEAIDLALQRVMDFLNIDDAQLDKVDLGGYEKRYKRTKVAMSLFRELKLHERTAIRDNIRIAHWLSENSEEFKRNIKQSMPELFKRFQ